MKELVWLGDSLARVRQFPDSVRDEVGFALYQAQMGGRHPHVRPIRGLGAGVMEIRTNCERGTFRTVYLAALASRIYVLHAFQKKSTKGIATPKRELDVVAQRLAALSEVRNVQ